MHHLLSATAALLLGGLVGTSAQAQTATPKPDLVQSGTLTYGVAATFAPFEFQSTDGTLKGFDIELGDALASKMGLSVAPLNMEFKGLIPALQGGRIDIINSAMYMNEDRAKQVDFVPYLRVGNEVVVRKGNPAGITGRDNSLCGKKVSVTLGGIQETYAREDNKRCTDAGLPAVEILTFPTAQDSALSLRQGRSDVHLDSTPGAVMMMQKVPDTYEIAGESFNTNTKIGIAVRKGDAAMKAAIEAALLEVVKDGTYAALITKYALPQTVALLK
ncbi:ABC transporter substrate-binding protein [Azospirillum sp. ST 5-10]|uniref:ABC transporter substrate-binding protein n=1 Tax=unclassified Azospirillum TaxID=2630922 RepID=UPI003F4A4D2F